MILPALFFYLFAGICVASAVMVIVSRNPVYSVLFLILGIKRVDLDFYSTRFRNLLFCAHTEARFCGEKRGHLAAAQGLSIY